MSRKIFVLVNVATPTIFDKPAILSSASNSVLSLNATGEHVRNAEAVEYIEENDIDLSGYDYNDGELHYFKRRAQARKAKRAIEASGAFTTAQIRVHELGEYDRSVKPVSSWKIEARVNKETAGRGADVEWFTYSTGVATRSEARRIVTQRKSVGIQRVLNNALAYQYDYRIVPVYA